MIIAASIGEMRFEEIRSWIQARLKKKKQDIKRAFRHCQK